MVGRAIEPAACFPAGFFTCREQEPPGGRLPADSPPHLRRLGFGGAYCLDSGKPVKLKAMGAIKRFILWDFPRGSWQYDVMVGLILAFIFLIPKTIFHDQPKPASVAILRNGFLLDPQVLSGVPEGDLLKKASAAVNAKYKTHTTIVSVDQRSSPPPGLSRQ